MWVKKSRERVAPFGNAPALEEKELRLVDSPGAVPGAVPLVRECAAQELRRLVHGVQPLNLMESRVQWLVEVEAVSGGEGSAVC